MDTYASPVFGNVPSPSSFHELLKLLQEPVGHWLVRMWRGQGDIEWPIHSTAYRRLFPKVSEFDLIYYEKLLLERADHRGFRFYEGRELPDMELLARLRHHGSATRFLDATRSALVGLWFCISDMPDKTGLLLGIHCNFLGASEGTPDKRIYEEIVKDLPTTHPQTWSPPNVSPRFAAQHSQLLYSPIANDKFGSLALPKEDGATLLIAITSDLKGKCTPVLTQVFDLTLETLFPDLEGFDIANSHWHDQWSNFRW